MEKAYISLHGTIYVLSFKRRSCIPNLQSSKTFTTNFVKYLHKRAEFWATDEKEVWCCVAVLKI
jgi:hypothetical protein